MSNLIAARDALAQFALDFDKWADANAGGDLNDYLKMFFTVRDRYEELDAERKKLYATLERMSRGLIPDLFQEKDVKTISIESIGRRFTVSAKMSASITDKTFAYPWLRNNNAEELIQPTVNASSLSSFAKTYTSDTGKDLPEEGFKVSTMRFTSVTKV